MSEMSIGSSSEVLNIEALSEGQSVGVWLDDQREVAIQKTNNELQKVSNPEQRAKLVSSLFFLRLGKLSEEQQQAAAEKFENVVITQMEKMVYYEQNPQMREFFQSWVEFQKQLNNIPFQNANHFAAQFEILTIREALVNESLSPQSRHILYQEFLIRLTKELSPEAKSKLASHDHKNCFYSAKEIFNVLKGMIQNAQKIETQELTLVLKAILEGKEPPKMSFPLLQVYELEKRIGVSLSKAALIEEELRMLGGLTVFKEMKTYPFLALTKEEGERMSAKLGEVVRSVEEAMAPYKGVANIDELSRRDVFGKLALLILHHQGKLFEGDSLKKALNFYWSKSPASPEEGIRIIKSLCSAAKLIGTENPADGEKLLHLIKSAYVDEQLYLSWFSSWEWKGCRAQALLELGKLAHELMLSSEKMFTEEAISLIKNISYSKESELQNEYGYSYSKKNWFNL